LERAGVVALRVGECGESLEGVLEVEEGVLTEELELAGELVQAGNLCRGGKGGGGR
jgi:hypothetical protein